jgi:hypothetical protein
MTEPRGKTRMTTPTPWGPAQTIKEIADGITECSTASHGGILISAERHAAMPECLRCLKPWAGTLAYEEDFDWALVVLAFPACFDPRRCWYALKAAKGATDPGGRDWLPPSLRGPAWPLDLAVYLDTDAGQALWVKADQYAAETAGLFEPGSWGTDGRTCTQWARCAATGAEIKINYPAGSRSHVSGAFALADVPTLFPGATVEELPS